MLRAAWCAYIGALLSAGAGFARYFGLTALADALVALGASLCGIGAGMVAVRLLKH